MNRSPDASAELEALIEARLAEREEANRRRYQAEKMASVGRLAAGVAHEVNNPLGFIRSNLATAAHYVDALNRFASALGTGTEARAAWEALELAEVMDDFPGLIEECLQGIDRIAGIVADLKGFSNIDRGEEDYADINDCLRQACALIVGRLPANIRLEEQFGPLPRLMCLPGYLSQAFLNVLENAALAIGGRLDGRIEVQSAVAPGPDGEAIVIRIHDNGCGIPERDLPHIFDPFFTTRPVGQGMGLGLSVVQDTLRLHGGEATAESRPGEGTTLCLRLPL